MNLLYLQTGWHVHKQNIAAPAKSFSIEFSELIQHSVINSSNSNDNNNDNEYDTELIMEFWDSD